MRSGLGGAFSAWIGLIALKAVVSAGGSGRVAEFFADVDALVEKLLDPSVPAIADRRLAAGAVRATYTAAPTPPAAQGTPRLPVPDVPTTSTVRPV